MKTAWRVIKGIVVISLAVYGAYMAYDFISGVDWNKLMGSIFGYLILAVFAILYVVGAGIEEVTNGGQRRRIAEDSRERNRYTRAEAQRRSYEDSLSNRTRQEDDRRERDMLYQHQQTARHQADETRMKEYHENQRAQSEERLLKNRFKQEEQRQINMRTTEEVNRRNRETLAKQRQRK